MKILVFNSGSSSIKYQLIEIDTQNSVCSGLVERIGEQGSRIKHKTTNNTVTLDKEIKNHEIGMEEISKLLIDEKIGVIKSTSEISAVGHRVVHGGESFNQPTLVTKEVEEAIRATIPLAPLHNPANLTGIESAEKLFQGIPQIAVFDTAFHQTMPSHSFHYAIPEEYYKKYKIRRYGFHGTSHAYVAKETAKLLGKPLDQLNIITLHLGNGASACAIKNGISVDTSMGLTPLEGLIMGTRSGDLDPAIIFYLAENANLSIKDIDKLLNKQSGVKGISGFNDMRDVEQKEAEGDKQSKLALQMYAYRIKKYIGSYYAALGRLDAIVFTAGVGENAPEMRESILSNMEDLGIKVDSERNKNAKKEPLISTDDSKVSVFVIGTNEELEIALQCEKVISNSK